MNKCRPPKLPYRFFRWYCHPDYLEDIEGDLLERYERNTLQAGQKEANWQFIKDVLKLFRPGIIKPIVKTQRINHIELIRNNLKLGFRHLLKRKGYAFINTLGLAVGFASTLLITLYVQNELSYDTHFSHADRTFKMVQKISSPDGEEMLPIVPYSLVNIVKDNYAEVEGGTAVSGPYNSQVVTVKGAQGQTSNFVENGALLADSNFFSVFSYEMISGNAKTALKEPHSVVLTESTAKRFFGDSDPLGQYIAPSGKHSVVTGVCKDPPSNSHLQFSYLVSSTSVSWLSQEKFNLSSAHCYFKLRQDSRPDQLESKLQSLIDDYVLVEVERTKKVNRNEYKNAGYGFEYYLKPLPSLHLSSENLGGFQAGGDITTVRILIAVAILILTIACINFINLATARATERVREVGVRKAIGSLKIQLASQYFMESFIITTLSILLGILMMIVALPYFNSITESSLIFPVTWQTVSLIMLAIVFISLATSIYPAFILSSLSPVAALKGKSLTTSKGKFFRNGLVGFQFCIAIVLIITTLIIQKQVDLIGNKQLGFDKEQVMVIEGIAHKKSHLFEPFLNEIRTFPEVKSAAGSLWIQGFSGTWKDNYRVLGQSKDHVFQRVIIGDQLAETLNFELKEGQLFSSDTNDSLSIIVNESAVTQMGLKDPVGQEIVLSKTNDGQIEEYNFIIKGVIKDFNYHTLHNPIEPLMIQNSENNHNRMRFIAAKLTDGFSRETVEKIESKWQEMFPERPFRFRFLDDTLDAKYKNEKKTINILTTFSFLTIFIACIGLFALSSYVIKLRIKEIGIRKILGASIKNIILKLSGNFSLIIFTSFLLAAPIGWYLGSMWLDNFAYKVTIDYEVFFWSGFIVSAVTIMTISFQTFRAAHTNPVDSLRNE